MVRRPRTKLQRRKALKEPRDRILIVCEGTETEPNYFKHLLKQLRLSSAKVWVAGKECGSAPKSIVAYAIQEIRQENDNPYDQVWCVFDVEIPKHTSLDEAYDSIIGYQPPQNSPTILKQALTNPCFEFWYILHFERTSRTYTSKKMFLDHLRRCIPGYNKADKDFPVSIYSKLTDAITRAESVIKEKHYGDDLRNCNPSTHVHLLVRYLQEVASR
jgi:hypothetical protein